MSRVNYSPLKLWLWNDIELFIIKLSWGDESDASNKSFILLSSTSPLGVVRERDCSSLKTNCFCAVKEAQIRNTGLNWIDEHEYRRLLHKGSCCCQVGFFSTVDEWTERGKWDVSCSLFLRSASKWSIVMMASFNQSKTNICSLRIPLQH